MNHLNPASLGVLRKVGLEANQPARVPQGVLDPLNDAKGRAAQLEALCPNARAVLLQAGHCPQDEQPELVRRGGPGVWVLACSAAVLGVSRLVSV